MRKAGDKLKERAESSEKPLIDENAPMTHGGKGGTRGTFSAAATKAGMNTQEYASKVLSDPNASPKMKKKANFARNASKWSN